MELNELKNNLLEQMVKLHCTRIRLDNNCGIIEIENGTLRYNYKYAMRYYKNELDAFKRGAIILLDNVDAIQEFNDSTEKVFSSTMYYKDFDSPNYNKSGDIPFRYECDMIDSGINVNGNVFSGTLNQLRMFLSFTNHHHRYCRCCHEYENDDVVRLIGIGESFGMFNYDSFSEYYRNSTVD